METTSGDNDMKVSALRLPSLLRTASERLRPRVAIIVACYTRS
jgi:hypothetical protein